MKTSLSKYLLQEYTSRQLNHFFPDDDIVDLKAYRSAFDLALDRLEFKHCTLKHYNDGTDVKFNHLYSDHYVMYLWFLSNSIWKLDQEKPLCNKLYYLNKAINGLDCMFDTTLPDIFLIFHGVGTMLGKAVYNDFFVVLHGCTVGSHKNKYPVMGKAVSLTANSSIIGDCTIGDRVNIGSGSRLFKKDIASDHSVAVDFETGRMESKTSNLTYAQQFFNVDLSAL
jgi:serine O-acetyltransferase